MNHLRMVVSHNHKRCDHWSLWDADVDQVMDTTLAILCTTKATADRLGPQTGSKLYDYTTTVEYLVVCATGCSRRISGPSRSTCRATHIAPPRTERCAPSDRLARAPSMTVTSVHACSASAVSRRHPRTASVDAEPDGGRSQCLKRICCVEETPQDGLCAHSAQVASVLQATALRFAGSMIRQRRGADWIDVHL